MSFFRVILSNCRGANSVLLFSDVVVGLGDFRLEPYLIFDLGCGRCVLLGLWLQLGSFSQLSRIAIDDVLSCGFDLGQVLRLIIRDLNFVTFRDPLREGRVHRDERQSKVEFGNTAACFLFELRLVKSLLAELFSQKVKV